MFATAVTPVIQVAPAVGLISRAYTLDTLSPLPLLAHPQVQHAHRRTILQSHPHVYSGGLGAKTPLSRLLPADQEAFASPKSCTGKLCTFAAPGGTRR